MKTKLKIWEQLISQGFRNINNVFYNESTPSLYEQAIRRREARVSHLGPLVTRTGQQTGRSPNDRFIVKESETENNIWWGDINCPIDEKYFTLLYNKMISYAESKDLYVHDCFAGTDEDFHLPVRVVTETAWHSLFARNMFILPKDENEIADLNKFTVIDFPYFQADTKTDGTNSPVFIIVHLSKKIVLIGGTSYAGEIKKSIFSVMNYLLPQRNVMTMHCAANIGKNNDSAVLFGLSGTGKTTLSADPKRRLIGDDEHGWSDKGVFNFEGGCYAKVINLSQEAEPDIYECTRKFGTILENVEMDVKSRKTDLFDSSLTENTRASYPITHISNIEPSGKGGHPKNIFMLTADAFGVLPPISKLTSEQAMYHFISGYTAKVAGTEKGITEPVATFSACYGAPFMPLHPSVYAELLGEKISKHNSSCWLINTGWSGGPYGIGKRMQIKYTRAMINAALEGELDNVETEADPIFGLNIPTEVTGVPDNVLNPGNTWESKEEYDIAAKKLAQMFIENFKKFESGTDILIINAGPNKI